MTSHSAFVVVIEDLLYAICSLRSDRWPLLLVSARFRYHVLVGCSDVCLVPVDPVAPGDADGEDLVEVS